MVWLDNFFHVHVYDQNDAAKVLAGLPVVRDVPSGIRAFCTGLCSQTSRKSLRTTWLPFYLVYSKMFTVLSKNYMMH